MLLSIIIVNYKTPQLLAQCISSIVQTISSSLLYEIIVVDNNSGDDSEKIVTSVYKQLIWIQKHENDGFGRANNAGIFRSNGKYLLLLNSDMILLPECIKKSLHQIQNDTSIGVLACQILNEDLSIQKSTYTFSGNAAELFKKNLILDFIFKLNNKNQGIKAFMGCYMLIPKAVIERCGMFDPDFFMYSEEIDLCRRITKMNYKLFFYTELNAIHLFGGSTTDNQWANHQKLLSNALLHLKSGGIFNYLLYHFIWHINLISNFFAMWLLDKDYRKNFFAEQKYYFSNFAYYITIPFLYTKKPGNGKRLLRRS